MHSRIIGLTDKQYFEEHPDEFEDAQLVLESRFEDPLPYFADYVSSDTDLGDDFNWLIESLVHKTDSALMDIDMNEHTIKFKPGFKERYFQDKWNVLVKQIIGAPNAFESFCGTNKSDFVYTCKNLMSTEFEFYISDEYAGYETLDEFIRRVNYDVTYKCFATLDYHF